MTPDQQSIYHLLDTFLQEEKEEEGQGESHHDEWLQSLYRHHGSLQQHSDQRDIHFLGFEMLDSDKRTELLRNLIRLRHGLTFDEEVCVSILTSRNLREGEPKQLLL